LIDVNFLVCQFLLEFQSLVLGKIVLRDVEVLKFANSRENHLFEERGEAIIVDEVHS
jgi:hypothetical protein